MAVTMITRSLNTTEVSYKQAILNDDFQVVVEEKTCILDGNYTEGTAQQYLEKKCTGKVKVTAVKTIDKVWGITLEDFVKYGKEVKRPPSQTKKADKEAEKAEG